MIDLINKIFKKNSKGNADIKEEGNFQRIQVAACALLIEAANADSDFSEAEKEDVKTILNKHFRLSDESVIKLMSASNRALDESIDLWHFTNLINENYSVEEKVKVIEMLWKVIYADGILNKYEDHLVHKISNLLRLTHKQLIEAKIRVIRPD